MNHRLFQLLVAAHGAPAYGLVFSVLLACGFGLPLPEDVALVTGGYLAFTGAANLWLMLAVGFAGILCGDLLVYSAGRRYGGSVTRTRWLRRYFTESKRERVEGYFAKYGQGIVVLARFLPGIRVLTYFTAGAARLGLVRFLVFDALAACVSAPLWVLVGHHLGRHLQQAVHWVERAHSTLIVAAALMGIGLVLYIVRRSSAPSARRRAAQPPPEAAELPIERPQAKPMGRVG